MRCVEFVVVGAGIAGLRAAISLAGSSGPKCTVLIVTKEAMALNRIPRTRKAASRLPWAASRTFRFTFRTRWWQGMDWLTIELQRSWSGKGRRGSRSFWNGAPHSTVIRQGSTSES